MGASKKFHDFMDALVDLYDGLESSKDDDRRVLFVTDSIAASDYSDAAYGMSIFRPRDVEAMSRILEKSAELLADWNLSVEERHIVEGASCMIQSSDYILSRLDDELESLLGNFSGSVSILVDKSVADKIDDRLRNDGISDEDEDDNGMTVSVDCEDMKIWRDNIEYEANEDGSDARVSFAIYKGDIAKMAALLNEKPAPAPK